MRALALAAMGLCIASCGACASTQVRAPDRGRAGVLRYAQITEPDSLNPITSRFSWMALVGQFAFSALLTTRDGIHLAPDVAREVPSIANGGVSRDGKTITYHLRRGIKWQDGVPLSAHDVEFSLRAIVNPKNVVATRSGYDQIERLDVPAADTVVVHLREPWVPILAKFFGPDSDYVILPAHLLEKYAEINDVPFNAKPIGSGPFKVSQWVRGDHITFIANDGYFQGKPRLRRLIFRVVPDQSSIVTGLQTGELDAWFGAEPPANLQVSKDGAIKTSLFSGSSLGVIKINTRSPILSDVRIRRALELSFNIKRAVRVASLGLYEPAPARFPYNPAAAARTLDNAGWLRGDHGWRQKGGRPLQLELGYNRDRQLSRVLAAVLQQDARASGIDLKLKQYTTEQALGSAGRLGIFGSGSYQLYIAWDVRGVDPDVSSEFGCDQLAPHGNNDTFWCDKMADALLKDGRSNFDEMQRRRDYAAFSRILALQVPEILLFKSRTMLISNRRFSYVRGRPSSWEMR